VVLFLPALLKETKWIQLKVLPAALPGILTGFILSLSRALGETAPLVLIGIPTSTSGAVSPSALERDKMNPVKIPGNAAGNTTRLIVCHVLVSKL
jgi:ABC-type phosphate transport system permease subunit